MEFFKYTLTNGIRCIFRRIKSPVAYCALTVNAGSRDEKPAESGIAHFTEHMLFKGTARRRAHHINCRLEKLGGELNAFTTKEETVVHATTLKGDLSKAAELISDIIFSSTFPAHEVEKEREVVLDEFNSYKDSPPERIYDEFEDLVFAGSQLGHNILGRKATVSKFRGEDIAAFVGRCYNTDQMVFSVAADIPESAFVRLADRYMGVQAPSLRAFGRRRPPGAGRLEKSLNRATHQAHCILGGPAYDMHHPRRNTLSLLVNILGGPAANSMLNVQLREKYGLTYNIDASYTPYSDTGILAVYFGTDKGKTALCIELIEKILRRLRTEKLTARQLTAAQKQFIGQLSISMESKEGYMLSAAKSELVYNAVDSPEVIYKKLLSITPSDILETAAELFGDLSILVYNGGGSYR
ncbi:MAG: insulinase family protein [Alistipes sp.]|nr:insulinase family protein [Alistipes sp.]